MHPTHIFLSVNLDALIPTLVLFQDILLTLYSIFLFNGEPLLMEYSLLSYVESEVHGGWMYIHLLLLVKREVQSEVHGDWLYIYLL